MKKKAIGLMDSGVGGLTILESLAKELPNEDFIYIGDNARAPYGIKTDEVINEYTDELVAFLLDQDIKLLVIACNTITALALDRLKDTLDIPVFGVIEPAAQRAGQVTQNGKVGLIGTKTTVSSGSYRQALSDLGEDYQIFEKATPSFVEIVEGNRVDAEETGQEVADQLQDFKTWGVDTLILGCTHFPYLEDTIDDYFDGDLKLVHAGEVLPTLVKRLLEEADLSNPQIKPGSIKIYTTGDLEIFESLAKRRLSDSTFDLQQIQLKGNPTNE